MEQLQVAERKECMEHTLRHVHRSESQLGSGEPGFLRDTGNLIIPAIVPPGRKSKPPTCCAKQALP